MTTPRRPRAWGDLLVNRIVASGADATPDDLLADFPEIFVKTVVRSIGRLLVFPDDRNATFDSVQRLDLGIGVAAEEAFLAGIVPDPDVGKEYPALGWIYRATGVMVSNNSSGTLEGYHYPELLWDTGANRKVDKGRLYLTMSNNIVDGTPATVRVAGLVRSLMLI